MECENVATTAVPVGRARGRDRTSAMLLAVHDAAAAALLASVAVVVVAVAAALATLVASAESHVCFLPRTVPFAESHVQKSKLRVSSKGADIENGRTFIIGAAPLLGRLLALLQAGRVSFR